MNDEEDDAWFAPKRCGYGAGLPIAWQGWALVAGLVALVVGAAPLAAISMFAYLVLAATATAVFLIICARKTRGGWRWRWGDPD